MKRARAYGPLALALAATVDCGGIGEGLPLRDEAPPPKSNTAGRRVDSVPVPMRSPDLEAHKPEASLAGEAAQQAQAHELAAHEPAEPVIETPPGYGIYQFPEPAPRSDELTMHGLAGYEVVVVYAEPRRSSAKLGYLRIGARSRVTRLQGREDCPKGWYQLPSGGFVCASRGFVVDGKRPPFMKYPPPEPQLDRAFPYEWAYVRRWNSPMWWRVPEAEEWTLSRRGRALRESRREGKAFIDPFPSTTLAAAEPQVARPKTQTKVGLPRPAAIGVRPASTSAAGVERSSDGGSLRSRIRARIAQRRAARAARREERRNRRADEPTPAKAVAARLPAASIVKEEVAADSAPSVVTAKVNPIEEITVGMDELPLSPAQPWLEKGYFLSLGERFEEGGREWLRTARGAYVEASALAKYEAKDFRGQEITPDMAFPMVGFIRSKKTSLYELPETIKTQLAAGVSDVRDRIHHSSVKLKRFGPIERRSFVQLKHRVEISGKSYFVTVDGLLVESSRVTTPVRQSLPQGIEPWEHWIDVDLDRQLLVAYEGEKPVYMTLVSTGKKGTAAESFATPTGRWRIYSKQVSSTMDGTTQSSGNYAIQDVPWVMFFDGNYALHGAFWHRSFGRVRSHGCVNLGPSDARWLFNWTTPYLPEGWHGVNSSKNNPGSTVIVRKTPSAP